MLFEDKSASNACLSGVSSYRIDGISPLPFGRRLGEGPRAVGHARGIREVASPHPNPLPEAEGASVGVGRV